MKIDELQITGLRGISPLFQLILAGKSLFLFGENGFGKSSITDALELWSTGDLEGYHRAGRQLGSAVHLDAQQAEVVVKVVTSVGTATAARTLGQNGKGQLTDPDTGLSSALQVENLPILRHETIGKFMDLTSGEKQKELLELLGLEGLTSMRSEVVKAVNTLKGEAGTAASTREKEEQALEGLTKEGMSLFEQAEKLASEAKLPDPAEAAKNLTTFELKMPPRSTEEDRATAVANLKTANEKLKAQSFESWNEAVAEEDSSKKSALAELTRLARDVVDADSDSCPVCGGEVVGDHLCKALEVRALELEEAKGVLDRERTTLDETLAAMRALETAISGVLKLAPEKGWTDEAALERRAVDLKSEITAISTSRQEIKPIGTVPEVIGNEVIARIDGESKSLASPEVAALVDLASLRAQALRCEESSKAKRQADDSLAAAQVLLEITEERISSAIEQALELLGEPASRFFAQIVNSPHHSDVKLVHKMGSPGKVEFEVLYDGRATVSPPQRSMSTSQLNALALALFLARIKLSEHKWRVCVLDDVVNSFDLANRQGLLTVLREEFEDWQVILLTHDRVFFDLGLQDPIPEWKTNRIDAWTPRGGPVLGEGDLLKRLKKKLADGKAADEMSGDARLALEWNIARAVQKLGYKARYDPHSRLGAREILGGLMSGLKENNSPIAGDPVLGRLKNAAYMSNLGVHNRPVTVGLERGDFQSLVQDLDSLDQALRCADCGAYVWKTSTTKGHQCNCGKLTA